MRAALKQFQMRRVIPPVSGPLTDPNVTAINAEGWSVTYSSPPAGDFDPVGNPRYVAANRAGYDSSAAAVSYSELLVLTRRVRLPYPNQGTLDASRSAMSDYLYSTDSVTGVVNNSGESSPRPIANWAMLDRETVGNSVHLEVAAFHRNARAGQQVAAIVFRASDGTNTVTQVVGAMTRSARASDLNPVLVYQCDLDISSLADGAITVNANVYPWIGGAASVLDSAAQSGRREFSPRFFNKSVSRAASPPLAYVSTTGNDGTGVVSTTAATASAAPFATIVGALNGLVAATGVTGGVVDGCEIRVGAGNFPLGSTTTTRPQTRACVTITRDPNTARSSAVVSWGAASARLRLGAAGGWCRLKDVTVQRTGTLTWTGETASILEVDFENVAFDGGSNNVAIMGSNVSGVRFNGAAVTNAAGLSVFNAGTFEIRMLRGVSVDRNSTAVEGWLVLGSSITRPGTLTVGTRTASGSIVAFNQLRSPTAVANTWGVGASSDVSGAAFVQNLVEATHTTVSTAGIVVSPDSASGNNTHIVMHNNTATGAFTAARQNFFYDEGPTARFSRLQSVKGNIWPQINHKGDVFRGANESGADASTRVGNWAYLYGVGCQGEFSQYIDADIGGIGGSFAQAYPGLAASIGASSTARNDPLFVNYQGTTYNGTTYTAGAGGGDYTLLAGSPCVGRLTAGVLPFDLAGNARSPTADSTGAYYRAAA